MHTAIWYMGYYGILRVYQGVGKKQYVDYMISEFDVSLLIVHFL